MSRSCHICGTSLSISSELNGISSGAGVMEEDRGENFVIRVMSSGGDVHRLYFGVVGSINAIKAVNRGLCWILGLRRVSISRLV